MKFFQNLCSIKADYQMDELHFQSLFQAVCTCGKTLPNLVVTFVLNMVRKLAIIENTCAYLKKGLPVFGELEVHEEECMQLPSPHLTSCLGAAVMTVKVVRRGSVEGCAVMRDVGQARQHW